MDSNFNKAGSWIPLNQAAKLGPYGADYLRLLARQKKIVSRKIGDIWHTTRESLLQYSLKQKEAKVSSGKKFRNYGEYFAFEFLPELPKQEKVLTGANVFQAASLSLVLFIFFVVGFATLENAAPSLASLLENKVENLSAVSLTGASQLASLLDGFNALRDLALEKMGLISTPTKQQNPSALPSLAGLRHDSDLPISSPSQTQIAITQKSVEIDLGSFKSEISSELKSELESYVDSKLTADSLQLLAPRIVYISPTINAPILRQEILLADTRPSITRQSDSDSSGRSSSIARLTDGGTFTSSTLTGATVSGPTGSFTNFTFTSATGTSATTTNFFSTTASSTNLFFTTGSGGNFTSTGLGTFTNLFMTGSTTLQNFTFVNATGTSATTTNFFSTTASSTNLFAGAAILSAATTTANFAITGNGSGLTFSGTGNHDITASAGTLRIGSNTIIGNIEALDDTVDIGTASTRFDKIYANEVNATTLVGTLTGGNLTAETFNINSDNATADTEDSNLAFERGSVSPNALLTWNSSADRFEFNNPVYISGNASTTGLFTAANLLITASSTLQNFTFVNATGTSATTTNFFSTTASSTNLFSTTLTTGNATLGAITSGLINSQTISSAANFTGTLTATGGLSTLSNLLVTGSSTLQNFTFLNATGTSATTTNFFSTTASSTNLFTSALTVNGKAFTVNGAPTLNDWFDQSVKTTASPTFSGLTLSGASVNSLLSTNSSGVITATSTPTFGNFNATSTVATSTISTGGFAVGTSHFVVQQSSGNVGIGTTGPGAKLHVSSGSILMDNTQWLQWKDAGGTARNILRNSDADVVTLAPSKTAGDIYITNFAATVNNVAFKDGGNVGIGTTGPAVRLHVISDSVSNPAAIFQSPTGGNGDFQVDVKTGTYGRGAGARYLQGGTLAATRYNWFVGANAVSNDTFEIIPSTAVDGTTFTTPVVSIQRGGNVGIGTTGPNKAGFGTDSRVITLQSAGADSTALMELGVSNNTSANAAGAIQFYNLGGGVSPVATAAIRGLRDGADDAMRLGLFTEATGAAFSEKLTILGSGNVGIGTTNPDSIKLDVEDDIEIGTGTTGCVRDADNTTLVGSCVSDERLKKNINPLSGILENLSQLRPVTFEWRNDEYPWLNGQPGTNYGLIAQEVEQVFPDMINTDERGYKRVSYDIGLTMRLLEGLKELYAEFLALKQTVLAFAENLVSNRIEARNEFCMGDVCITPDQFKTLLEKNGIITASASASQNEQSTINNEQSNTDTATTTEPVIESASAEETATSTQEIVAEPESETAPEPIAETPVEPAPEETPTE